MNEDWWQPELPFSLWPMDWRNMKMTEFRKTMAKIHEQCFWHMVNIDPTSGASTNARHTQTQHRSP